MIEGFRGGSGPEFEEFVDAGAKILERHGLERLRAKPRAIPESVPDVDDE
jgi:hypothetical protein